VYINNTPQEKIDRFFLRILLYQVMERRFKSCQVNEGLNHGFDITHIRIVFYKLLETVFNFFAYK